MIGGVKVAKGDIIFMDIHDGVVICIPREKAEQVLEWLKANMTEDAKRRVKAGIPANQLFVPGIFAAAQFERPVMGSMLIKEDDVIFSRKTPFGLDIDHALTKREEEHIRGDKEAASQKKKILDRKKNGPKTPRKANARQKITEDDQLPEDIEEARDSEDTEENEGLGSDDDAEGGGTQTQAKRKPTTTRKRKAPAKKSGKANAKNTDKESGFEENPKKKVQKASTRQTAKKPPVVYSAESDLDSETEAAPARTRRTRIAKNQAAPPEGPITEGAEGDEPVVEAEQMPKKGSRAKRNVKGGAKTAAAARKKPAPQKGTGRPVRGRKKVLVIDDSGDDDKPEPEPSGEDDDEFEPADD